MENEWQLQEAKNKLSEVINLALSAGPQLICEFRSNRTVKRSMPHSGKENRQVRLL